MWGLCVCILTLVGGIEEADLPKPIRFPQLYPLIFFCWRIYMNRLWDWGHLLGISIGLAAEALTGLLDSRDPDCADCVYAN